MTLQVDIRPSFRPSRWMRARRALGSWLLHTWFQREGHLLLAPVVGEKILFRRPSGWVEAEVVDYIWREELVATMPDLRTYVHLSEYGVCWKHLSAAGG